MRPLQPLGFELPHISLVHYCGAGLGVDPPEIFHPRLQCARQVEHIRAPAQRALVLSTLGLRIGHCLVGGAQVHVVTAAVVAVQPHQRVAPGRGLGATRGHRCAGFVELSAWYPVVRHARLVRVRPHAAVLVVARVLRGPEVHVVRVHELGRHWPDFVVHHNLAPEGVDLLLMFAAIGNVCGVVLDDGVAVDVDGVAAHVLQDAQRTRAVLAVSALPVSLVEHQVVENGVVVAFHHHPPGFPHHVVLHGSSVADPRRLPVEPQPVLGARVHPILLQQSCRLRFDLRLHARSVVLDLPPALALQVIQNDVRVELGRAEPRARPVETHSVANEPEGKRELRKLQRVFNTMQR